MGSERPRLAVAIWVAVLALSAWQLARTRIVADLSAFLPPSATPTQQLLLEQMRSGVGSRILLIALGGASEERLAQASQAMATTLRSSGLFAALRGALESGLGELATQPGAALRSMVPRDPTGELRRIVERLPASGPPKRAGVWFSADGERALLVGETLAGGFD